MTEAVVGDYLLGEEDNWRSDNAKFQSDEYVLAFIEGAQEFFESLKDKI